MPTPRELEQIIYELEEVRVVVRAAANSEVGVYPFVRKAAGNTSITEWLQQRVIPAAAGYEVAVIDGNGVIPHGRTKMETLRSSYIR